MSPGRVKNFLFYAAFSPTLGLTQPPIQWVPGGKIVSLTRQPAALYPQEKFWYSFLLEAESTPRP
jgi:hypothetical protein